MAKKTEKRPAEETKPMDEGEISINSEQPQYKPTIGSKPPKPEKTSE